MPERVKTGKGVNRAAVIHAVRTTVAAVVSLLVARLLRLPEAYWAAITALIVMQSTLGAALTASGQRLVGTAIGAVLGALFAAFLPPSVLVFGAAVFVSGLICAFVGAPSNDYRFATVTIAIILLIVRSAPPVLVAVHRFLEVSAGIVVALGVTAVWPEPEQPK